MKTRPLTSPSSGVALVIVLSFLVLISAITLGFFSSVSNELATSKTISNTALARQLSDSAVNVAMAQIVDATKGQDTGSKALAWASQPGMIRTFDATGAPKDFFKLYSSDKMTVPGSSFKTDDDVPPNDWNVTNNTELYTDLNAPAANINGELVYPILDPSADGGPSPGRPDDGFKVDGFSLTASPGYSGSNQSPTNNRAPMPVKWIYVLKDGTLRPATSPSATGVTVTGASAANPIVGRIAFWADDETAKVNINTASEGVYWDMPRIYSQEDVGNASTYQANQAVSPPGLALGQPATGEFQRYPGHPATTSLSPIFGSVKILPSPVPSALNKYAQPIAAGAVSQLDWYYNLAPRIGLASGGGGGSKAGTLIPPSTALNRDSDRLYASVDELIFSPKSSGVSRIPNTASGTATTPNKITKGIVEKAGFFITATSSAPEVTLHNTPRVAIWPVDFLSNKRTAYDKLSAFCGTISGQEYSLTRQTRTGTTYPGSRSATADLSARNLALYAYLQKMTQTAIPGFGGTFSNKFQADNDQILTSIFDYIRCVNLCDTSPGASPYTPITSFNDEPSTRTGGGEVIPIRMPNNTQGFGRFATVTEFTLVFHKTKTNKMKAVVLLGFGTPMQGNVGYQSGLKYRIKGLPTELKIATNADGSNGTNFIECSDAHTHHGRGLGGIEGPAMALTDKKWAAGTNKLLKVSGGATKGNYPFFSKDEIDVPAAANATFSLPEANITVEILTADTGVAGDKVVQTLHFKMPATTGIKAPDFANNALNTDFNERVRRIASASFEPLIQNQDTVLALQIAGVTGKDSTVGDMRMIAGRIDVPETLFQPHKDWKSPMAPNISKAFGLLSGLGLKYPGGSSGPLVANANYMGGGDRQPGIPSRVPATTGVRRADDKPGDWDSGTGVQKDGAFINKADEGDMQFTNWAGGGVRIPYISKDDHFLASGSIFSPNRQVASSMMFGSIPTGVLRNRPWETLSFHPRPEDPTHPGNQATSSTPKDHLLADLFWMPVVEPWAISQPFATSGKINLNYQIQPFTYIQRSTGIHAVMKSTQFLALPVGDAAGYKPHTGGGYESGRAIPNRRRPIDMEKTLLAFGDKFKETDNKNNIFKSPTQICEMNLVPANSTVGGNLNVASYKNMAAFWNGNTLTGDNVREKPYVDIYPRLTTKSNSFTVHVRVQALKKAPGTPAGQWVAGRDTVVGEYRGSSLLERYIDVNDPALPDFATKFTNNPSDPSLNIDQYYKMRVVSTKRFSP